MNYSDNDKLSSSTVCLIKRNQKCLTYIIFIFMYTNEISTKLTLYLLFIKHLEKYLF